MPSLVLGGIAAAGSLGGALIQSSAAKSAAQTQADAANNASNNTLSMFNTTQQNLAPFLSAGQNALTGLQSLTGSGPGGNPLTAPLTKPFQPTMDQLAATPGYQFTLQQGELATQNSYAAQGLGTSGAAAKGAANYAEGLASTTYQQQFQNYLSQNQQIYNMLGNQVSLGENAGATTGSQGLAATNQAGAFSTAGAAAQAAGTVGSANAYAGGLSSTANATTLGLLGNSTGLFNNADVGGSTQAQDFLQDSGII